MAKEKPRLKIAARVRELPPYLFARIDKLKEEVLARGVDVIDMGIGDPDQPTPMPIVQHMSLAIKNPANHKYPSYSGSFEYRKSCAEYLRRRTKVRLDPETEILALIGSKEGIAHLPLAFIDPGDIALAPDPGYPVYATATRFCGGVPYFMPLKEENGFLPDFDAIPVKVWKKARILFLNYPNNPTGARATRGFLTKAVKLATQYNVLIAHDAAHFEIYSGRARPLSVLEIPGGRNVAIEFFSHSKTYNMTGWRIGFAAGAEKAVNALSRVKNNMDSGVFTAIQQAAIAANSLPASLREEVRRIYSSRRKYAVAGLRDAGFDVFDSGATFFVWVKVPGGMTSTDFAMKALSKQGVVVTPGVGFGEHGEGYFRISLCLEEGRVTDAVRRLERILG